MISLLWFFSNHSLLEFSRSNIFIVLMTANSYIKIKQKYFFGAYDLNLINYFKLSTRVDSHSTFTEHQIFIQVRMPLNAPASF